jgi:hypothetical protein
MSENNSPSEELNQEPSSAPDEKTDPNLVHSEQQLNEAMLEKDSLAATETLAPRRLTMAG